MPVDSPEDRILAAIRAIPRGSLASYGEIARRAGLPRRARLVARLLSLNSDPDLPWHRVLRADGRIAFLPGSKGYREQSARLKREGVNVEKGRARVRVGPADIDALIWGPPTKNDAGRGHT